MTKAKVSEKGMPGPEGLLPGAIEVAIVENGTKSHGDSRQLTMLKSSTKSQEASSYPLRDAVIKYEAPTEPVGIEDWDALQ